jgi:single-stranded DNA-binding protein
MSQYDNTNRGIISKNTRKELDTHPDIKGQINVDGVEFWLDGWLKQRNDGTGSFYSLSVKPKNAPAAPAAPAAAKPAQKAAPKPAPASGGFDNMDDDIPF